MRVVGAVLIALLCLAIVNVYALPSLSDAKVSRTNMTVMVDGTLNMTSEWNGSTVVAWSNPLGEEELDTVYLLHNGSHYLFGAILYDPDNIDDDSLAIYVNWGVATYKYVVSEGSSAIELYNITDTSEPLTSNGTAVMTQSSPSMSWLCMEMVLPKGEWGSASTVRVLFEHRHTFKIDTTSRYPCDANVSDASTWLEIEYVTVLGQYRVELSFTDRDGASIEYIADKSYVLISFLNGTEYVSQALSNSSLITYLPPENYTVTFYAYGVAVFNTTVEVEANITSSHKLENLKLLSTPLGDIVAVVELPGEIGSLYLEPENQIGMLISNSTEPISLRLFPRVAWNYTFVAVLNALNFTYNPFTKSLLAYTQGNLSGMLMIGAPKEYPVFYFADGTVKGYVYNHELEEMGAWILNGTYEIFNTKEPFAVTLNNTALKRGQDYSVDPFNVTSLTAGSGELRVYYRNPSEIEVEVFDNTARVLIATPYVFNGKVELTVKGSENVTKTETFVSTPPLTIVDLSIDGLEPGDYTLEVVVTDEDSQKVLGTASESYAVEEVEEWVIRWEYYVLAIVVVAIIAALILASRAAKQAVEDEVERRRRFVRRKY